MADIKMNEWQTLIADVDAAHPVAAQPSTADNELIVDQNTRSIVLRVKYDEDNSAITSPDILVFGQSEAGEWKALLDINDNATITFVFDAADFDDAGTSQHTVEKEVFLDGHFRIATTVKTAMIFTGTGTPILQGKMRIRN